MTNLKGTQLANWKPQTNLQTTINHRKDVVRRHEKHYTLQQKIKYR